MLEPEAIVIVGVGDGVSANTMNVDLLAQRLRKRFGHDIVEAVDMEPGSMQLFEAFGKCVQRGARVIMVVPYVFELDAYDFSDLARAVSESARKLHRIQIVISKPLGFDESLVRLVDKRIRESEGFPDVRELSLVRNEEYGISQRYHIT